MAKANRICDRCRKPYYRSNRLRLWTGQNPGHRAGWQKDDVKLCCSCLNAEAAGKAQRLVSAKIVTISMRKAS